MPPTDNSGGWKQTCWSRPNSEFRQPGLTSRSNPGKKRKAAARFEWGMALLNCYRGGTKSDFMFREVGSCGGAQR